MITNILLFGLLLTRAEPTGVEPPRPLLTTFGAEASSFGQLLGYKCSMTSQLEGSPVVAYYSKPVQSLNELTAFCRQLDVSVERDEDKKVLRFSVPATASNVKLNESIERALRTALETYASYRNATYQGCYQEFKRNIKAKVQAKGIERLRLDVKESVLIQATLTRGRAMLNSLLDVPSGFDYVRPSSTKYALPLSEEASSMLSTALKGESIETSDVMDHENIDAVTWEAMKREGGDAIRKEYRLYGLLQPIPYLTHQYSRRFGSLYVSLRVLVPPKPVIISSLTIPIYDELAKYNSSIDPFPDSDKPFTPLMPFKHAPAMTQNAVGILAANLKKNYVGWLDERPFKRLVSKETVLSNLVRDIEPTEGAIRVSLDDDWLSVKSNGVDLVRSSANWQAFPVVQPIVDDKPSGWSEIQNRLSKLTSQDCSNLESIKQEFNEELGDSYSGVTSGIRILRALTLQQNFEPGRDFDLEIGKLSPDAKSILLPWFNGDYIYAYYTHLLHPLNAAAIRKFHVQAKFSKDSGGILKFRVTAVVGSDGPPFQSLWFSIPVRAAKN